VNILWHIQLQLKRAQTFQDIAQLALCIPGVNEDVQLEEKLSELAPVEANQMLIKFFLSW
jgi:hypothetical protein